MRLNSTLLMTLLFLGMAAGRTAFAQNGPYHPGYPLIDPRQMNVGQAGEWMLQSGRVPYATIQPVQLELETGGEIDIFQGSIENFVTQSSADVVGLAVGPVYRLRLRQMPGFPPGTEIYPTIELLDRLHPPPGREAEFPVVIHFTVEEINLAREGRLVTKVVYLEQPQIIPPRNVADPVRITDFSPAENLVQAADRLGRPMAIIRLGGRQPTQQAEDARFFGNAPVVDVTPPALSEPAIPVEPRPNTNATSAGYREY